MSAHPVLWTSPTPLWGRFGPYTSVDQARPSILRFASDDFMERMLAMLAADPRRIGEVIARPETWRTEVGATPDLVERVPMPRIARALARIRTNGAAKTAVAMAIHEDEVTESSITRTVPLKLYHPAHQRHYLVTANLVCGIPGFPDRAVAGGGREKIGYVLRRLLLPPGVTDESKREEFAFVKEGGEARWQRVSPLADADDPAGVSVDGEEMLPLFPLSFRDETDHPRRMFGGLIPVGRRDEYLGTRAQRGASTAVGGGVSETSAVHGATVVHARKEQFKNDVAEPWKNLVRTAYMSEAMMSDTDPLVAAQWNPVLKNATSVKVNVRLQGESWLILLDFANFLKTHVKKVWAAVESGSSAGLSDAERKLFEFLNTDDSTATTYAPVTDGNKPYAASLRLALKEIVGHRNFLERTTKTFPESPDLWPDHYYLLAGMCRNGNSFRSSGPHMRLAPSRVGDPANPGARPASSSMPEFENDGLGVDSVTALVTRALDTTQGEPSPAVPFAARLRDALVSTQGDDGWFALRCVYVRCDCGPLDPNILSQPSQRFQLASFFDSDAPARPIQINLPLDTTPAGLRKHKKNTAFVISDVLCGQIQRAKGLGLIDLVLSVLPWPLHKDLDVAGKGACTTAQGNALGMICSLSIPIVTICALILLLIIVSLLDIVFKWMPYLIFCFPVPGLKAKKGNE